MVHGLPAGAMDNFPDSRQGPALNRLWRLNGVKDFTCGPKDYIDNMVEAGENGVTKCLQNLVEEFEKSAPTTSSHEKDFK